MKARHHTDAALLSAYLEGEVTASERAAIEAELRDSAEARRTLEQLRGVKELLASPAGELEEIDLAARVRSAASRQRVAPSRAHGRRWSALWLGGLAACLGGLFFMLQPGGISDEFHAKSNATALSPGKRWAGMQIHRVGERGTPELLGEQLVSNDGLLFSYTNLGPAPFDYLMIFAIDASNEVRWFYPAYETAGTNPESIAIEHGRANVPLGELLQQSFAEGPLTLYALFTKKPFSVLEMERWVKQHGRPSESPIAGGMLQRVDTRVAR